MASKTTADEQYKGTERRFRNERRNHPDRRNLVRFETLGSDRREDECRRDDELCIKLYP